MPARFPQSALEVRMVDRYPIYYDAAAFCRTVRAIMANVNPDGRRLLARVLRAVALGLEEQLTVVLPTFIVPQVVLWQRVATDCRDLAAAALRYAGASTGPCQVTLSIAARNALALLESHDPGRGIDVNLNPARTTVRLIQGVTIA